MNALKPLLGLLLVLSLSACGGGASSERGAPTASGPYASAQYTDAQLKPYLDQVYSTRPNEGGLQYTSAKNKAAELGSQTLSLQLDLWVPPNAVATAPQPLVVWIHGGGFFQGGKEENRDKALSYARAGYVSATINYRLTDGNESSKATRIKAQTQAAEDVANAIRFLRQNAANFHIDSSRVATLGGSAGGRCH
jgi:acetyl esterase/lipase